MRQDGFSQYGSQSITTTAGSGVECKGAAFVVFEALTVDSTPQIKAYGKLKSGTFKPIDYQKITAAGVWSSIDADTASGALSANDRIIVPNPGYSHVRIVATTGSLTVALTINPEGGLTDFLLQKLIDGGLSATITQPDAIIGPGDPVVDSYASVAINLTTGANQVLVSSAASKQIWVYGIQLSVGDADGQTISLQDEDDAALSGIMEFAQYGGMAPAPSGNFAQPLLKLATNKDLEIDITGGDADGMLQYAIVSV